MATAGTITFSISPISTGTASDANEYAQLIASHLQATLTGNFLSGQIDGTPPTQNIGVWLNQGVWYIWDPNSNTYVPQTVTTVPAGVIEMYGGAVAPSGYLFCDGTLYLRSQYQALYNVISNNGTIGQGGNGVWGPDDGVSTFRVPDFRGRTPVGTSNIGISLPPTITSRPSGTNVGEETHVLTSQELAAHTHSLSAHTHGMQNHTHVGADHSHSMQGHVHGMQDHYHGMDHYHNIGGGQFAHNHGDNGHGHPGSTVNDHEHTLPYASRSIYQSGGAAAAQFVQPSGATTGGMTTQPGVNVNTGFASIAVAALPGGNTVFASQTNGAWQTTRFQSDTGSASSGLGNTGGPNTGNTSFSLQAPLITGGPTPNTTVGPNIDATTNNTPAGSSHNNMQPSLVCLFIIKT